MNLKYISPLIEELFVFFSQEHIEGHNFDRLMRILTTIRKKSLPPNNEEEWEEESMSLFFDFSNSLIGEASFSVKTMLILHSIGVDISTASSMQEKICYNSYASLRIFEHQFRRENNEDFAYFFNLEDEANEYITNLDNLSSLLSDLSSIMEQVLRDRLNLDMKYYKNDDKYANAKRQMVKPQNSTTDSSAYIKELQKKNYDELEDNLLGRKYLDIIAVNNYSSENNYWIIDNHFYCLLFDYISEVILENPDTMNSDLDNVMDQFTGLRAEYFALNGKSSTSPEYDVDTDIIENKKEKPNINNDYAPIEVRREMVKVYTKLAGEIGIDTEYISQVFKTDDEPLWDAINKSRMGKKHDGFPYQNVKLVPFLALIGVLKKQKKIGGMKEYVNKINAGFDKDAAYQICKDCSQSDPDKRPQLAEEIIYRLQ